VESPRSLEGGPVWTESAFAFDSGCQLTGLSNAGLALVIPLWADRRVEVAGETIRRWRQSRAEVPFWALRGLWRKLRHDGHDGVTLKSIMGFGFVD
jgi:hypothetical protein